LSPILYVISAYRPGPDRILRPDLPTYGPCSEWDENPCKLGIDHYRNRKQGPGPALCVMRCSTHDVGFTIYPPGWAPYARKALAPVGLDGSRIHVEEGTNRFAGTLFDAALDACNHLSWPKETDSGSIHPRFTTQIRHLERSAFLLGIHPVLHERLREETAQILEVPGQLLHDGAALIKVHTGYLNMGQACSNVLESIPDSNAIFESLVQAGSNLCFWPVPFLWDSQQSRLRRSMFHGIGTFGSPG